ncbi:MAG: sigma-70 family RNA polymerase sigma factor [Anaerolineaceae bacterium]|nr:sigma-70 family RNA polymerase sigma factor [Anaerolineaceae bacterium]
MSETTDHSLVSLTLSGKIEAYGELVKRYQASVFNVCFRVLRNHKDAEDLAQETFIRAFQRLKSFDANRPFGPWVRKIAANSCINYLKRSNLQKDFELEEEMKADSLWVNGTFDSPENTIARKEFGNTLQKSLLSMPAHYRIAIELRHFQDLTYEEMATAMDLPLNTVKSHLYRGRKILSEKLRELNYA